MNNVLGAVGVVTGAATQTRLVTPYQNVTPAFTAFLESAHISIRSMIYSATLAVYFDTLIQAKKQGLDVKVIFDHSQAGGHAEKADLNKLLAAGWVDGKDFVIGTSPVQHQICHIKATVIDHRWVEDGSLNYSYSGLNEVNTVCFSDWAEWAQYLESIFDQLWTWILQHEPAYQITP